MTALSLLNMVVTLVSADNKGEISYIKLQEQSKDGEVDRNRVQASNYPWDSRRGEIQLPRENK